MKKITSAEPESKSDDVAEVNLEALAAIFPSAFTEGEIDFDVLRQLFGDTVDEKPEKYGLNWHGKRAARQFALTPSAGTLRPNVDASSEWETTHNMMIEGDNLEVLKLLQKSYAGRVKLIYIDPPYNTGRDFVYPDKFGEGIAEYLRMTGQTSSGGVRTSSNAETSGRFHTTWLNMIYPRLFLARTLLAQDGVMMISIDDNEVASLKQVLAELFGDENMLAVLIWNKQHSQQQGLFKRYHEYVLAVTRDAAALGNITGGGGEIVAGALKKISSANPASDFTFPPGVRFEAPDGTELSGTFGDSEKVTVVEGVLACENGRTRQEVTLRAGWTQKNQMASFFAGEETFDSKGQRVLEFFFNSAGKLKCRKERSSTTPPSILPKYGMVSEQTAYLTDLMGAAVFPTPKPVEMGKDFVSWFVDEGDVVLDFFAGSGTMAESVWAQCAADGKRRRVILVQLPEELEPSNAEQRDAAEYCDTLGVPRLLTELTKERLRRAGAKIRAGLEGQGVDTGFRVFRLADSNMKEWNPDRDDLDGSLLNSLEHIKEGRSETDILFELILKLGLELTASIETREVGGVAVHSVGAGTLIACLADKLSESDVEHVALGIADWHRALDPVGETTVVFRDDAFASDVARTNMTAILEQRGLATVRSL